jgi:hypothetical protein
MSDDTTNTYGWFSDLDTDTEIVVLECKHDISRGVYCVRPVYLPYYSYPSKPITQTNISLNFVHISNLDDDIEHQRKASNSSHEKTDGTIPKMVATETYTEQARRIWWAITICVLYVCICAC